MEFCDEVKSEKNCYTEPHNKEKIENVIRYIYHFDYPSISGSGFVEIFPDEIRLIFPAKPNKSINNVIPLSQNVSVYIHHQLRFSYHWLPIYSLNDLYKIKDMFMKACYEYKLMTGEEFSKKIDYIPRYCSEILTEKKNSVYEIVCFENSTNTTFDIDFKKGSRLNNINTDPFVDLKIYIGENLIFSGMGNLLNYNLPAKDVQFIINMLLEKIIK
jgi:hypothetical protein